MIAEIITIGDELLIGQTVDTNSAWMGAELSRSGFDILRRLSVHDRREDILFALENVSPDTNVVLITGGLGPTSDDITKQTLCEFFGTELVVDKEVLSMITEMMARRNIGLNENNRKQAEVPASCRVLTNAKGTAPGMWFEKQGRIFVSMPGVPVEMKYIMSTHVIPELNNRFRTQVIIHRNIMTIGTYEARLAELLTDFEATLPKNVKLAYLPSSGVIKLRLTGTDNDRGVLDLTLSNQVSRLHSYIHEFIFAEEETSLEAVVGSLLREKKATLSTAESCTGGRISQMITSIPGSSEYFRGSIIAYHNDIKSSLLGVSTESLERYGAVSEEVAAQMAEGVRKLTGTDFSVATTGIAGPGGGSPLKPVGTICIGVASPARTVSMKYIFGNERVINIDRFATSALNLLRSQIINQ